jgi:hypothetical protein
MIDSTWGWCHLYFQTNILSTSMRRTVQLYTLGIKCMEKVRDKCHCPQNKWCVRGEKCFKTLSGHQSPEIQVLIRLLERLTFQLLTWKASTERARCASWKQTLIYSEDLKYPQRGEYCQRQVYSIEQCFLPQERFIITEHPRKGGNKSCCL